jgi:endo-1,4-beta-D-glucanase Y
MHWRENCTFERTLLTGLPDGKLIGKKLQIMIQPNQRILFYPALLIMVLPFLSSSRVALPDRPAPARPFPQHASYRPGSILPNHVSQTVLDDSVRSFYQQWKKHYVLTACEQGQAYVWFEGTAGTNKCVSEGQGYGMMIVALMAGFDSSAQDTYDRLFRWYRSHPTRNSAHLMAWSQDINCHSIDGTSATDGDLDIAYSLLLADAQWGSGGNISYRQEAIDMISSILQQEINPVTFYVMQSNAINQRSRDYFDVRSSDFMPDHFRAFKAASGDARWDSAINNNYRLFRHLEDTYSPDAGLIPDFIRNGGPGTAAFPAQPHYLESTYDGKYNFNACRVPWRIGTDFLLYGDQRADTIIKKINSWIRGTTKDNPDNISAGYSLEGDDLKNRNYEALCFIAPFSIAAMASPDNQPWLNKLWDYIVHFPMREFDYYDNSIKMINMIILSGNYWTPQSGAKAGQVTLN